jgi:putative transposase
MAIYEALDIRKERIDPRQSWQNYIEAHFGIMRRLVDFYLNKAPTLDEMKKAHRKFIRDYNCQIHFAQRERQDGRHSPQDVLRGVLARTLPAPQLSRIFFATEFTRYLDRSGYIRFRRWRFYAEEGLAKQQVQISIYTSTLKIEYQDTELAFYTMEWAEDDTHIKEVKNPRLIETGYQSSQLKLWTLGPDEWLLFLKLPDYASRKKRKQVNVVQLPLPEIDENQLRIVSF